MCSDDDEDDDGPLELDQKTYSLISDIMKKYMDKKAVPADVFNALSRECSGQYDPLRILGEVVREMPRGSRR